VRKESGNVLGLLALLGFSSVQLVAIAVTAFGAPLLISSNATPTSAFIPRAFALAFRIAARTKLHLGRRNAFAFAIAAGASGAACR